MCWYRKHSFIIELKVKGNYLSKEQKNEMKGFVRHEIPVHVVYTPDEFLKVLELEIGMKMSISNSENKTNVKGFPWLKY